MREEFKQKAQQYQEQIQLSKEMITKLQEMNVDLPFFLHS